MHDQDLPLTADCGQNRRETAEGAAAAKKPTFQRCQALSRSLCRKPQTTTPSPSLPLPPPSRGWPPRRRRLARTCALHRHSVTPSRGASSSCRGCGVRAGQSREGAGLCLQLAINLPLQLRSGPLTPGWHNMCEGLLQPRRDHR